MKRRIIQIMTSALMLLLLSAVTAMGDKFPYPKVDFSADMTMTFKQGGSDQPHVIQGKVYSSQGKERREVSRFGRKTVIIKHRGKQESWTLMPDQKMYMINRGGQRRDPERMIRDGEMTLTRQGKEKVNGHRTIKYKISTTGDAREAFEGFAWFTEENIPVRIMGTARDGNASHDVRIEHANIHIARQSPDLFKIPPGYRLVNTGMPGSGPAGYGGAGGNMPQGLTPEQIEQLKKMMQGKKDG